MKYLRTSNDFGRNNHSRMDNQRNIERKIELMNRRVEFWENTGRVPTKDEISILSELMPKEN